MLWKGKLDFLHWETDFIFSVVLVLAQMCNLTCQIQSLIHFLIFAMILVAFSLVLKYVHFFCSSMKFASAPRLGTAMYLSWRWLQTLTGLFEGWLWWFSLSVLVTIPVSTGVLSVHAVRGSVSHVFSFISGDDHSILSLIKAPNCYLIPGYGFLLCMICCYTNERLLRLAQPYNWAVYSAIFKKLNALYFWVCFSVLSFHPSPGHHLLLIQSIIASRTALQCDQENRGRKIASVTAALGKLCIVWIGAGKLGEGLSGLRRRASSSTYAKKVIVYFSWIVFMFGSLRWLTRIRSMIKSLWRENK